MHSVKFTPLFLALVSVSVSAQTQPAEIRIGELQKKRVVEQEAVQEAKEEPSGSVGSAPDSAGTPRSKRVAKDERPIMWGKVRAGMSIAEIRALYPQDGGRIKWHGNKQTEVEDVVILDGCEAEVEIQHESGHVDVIKVKGRGSIVGRCSDKVFSALAAKYGQPDGNTRQRGSLFKRGKSSAIWNRDGITMKFLWMDDNGLGGGGLLQSSWQMEYEASASTIAL